MPEYPPSGPPAQEERPEDPAWRADPLARSSHARLSAGEPTAPILLDPEGAADLCAAITREMLGDYAPALALLPRIERRRVQVLLAYLRTLFDFARQPGTDGERLAQLNRLEFDLERALLGSPPEQPIFLRMAIEERLLPWSRPALDRLAQAARRRATRLRSATQAEVDGTSTELASAVLASLNVETSAGTAAALGEVLLQIWSLQHLGSELRGHRSLAVLRAVSKETAEQVDQSSQESLLAAVRAECLRLRARLASVRRQPSSLKREYRRAATYALLAGTRLLDAVDGAALTADFVHRAPHLALSARIGLLLRARWFGR